MELHDLPFGEYGHSGEDVQDESRVALPPLAGTGGGGGFDA